MWTKAVGPQNRHKGQSIGSEVGIASVGPPSVWLLLRGAPLTGQSGTVPVRKPYFSLYFGDVSLHFLICFWMLKKDFGEKFRSEK